MADAMTLAQRLRESQQRVRAGDVQAAEDELYATAAENPESSAPCLALAMLYRQQGRLPEVVTACSEAVQREEENAAAYIVLGNAQWQLDLIEDARRSFDRALSIAPNDAEGLFGLALTYVGDDPGRAENLLRAAIMADHLFGAAYRELGYLVWRKGGDAEAEGYIRRAVELQANDRWAHYYLGQILVRRGRLAEALVAAQQAATLEPPEPLFLCGLAEIHVRAHDHTSADEVFQRALAVAPDSSIAHRRYGAFLRAQGDMRRARRHLALALQFDPDDRRARAMLTEIGEE
jgi:Tfp pilus assembly protein PilF